MSGQEMEVHQGSVLAVSDAQDRWNAQQIAALAQLGMADVTEGDLAVFLHHVQRTGLDPFARQVYMISRNVKNQRTDQWETKWTIQTSIDGFRLIGRRAADRTGETLGMSDTEWCDPDGVWHDVWLWDRPPSAARVRILRNGQPFPGLALFAEYAQYTRQGNLTKMWADKPALMIAKCAEALAWRRAFPQDLSGLYTSDEMSRDQAEANQRAIDALPPTPEEGPEPTPDTWPSREQLAHEHQVIQAEMNRRADQLVQDEARRAEHPSQIPPEQHRDNARAYAAQQHQERHPERRQAGPIPQPQTAEEALQRMADWRQQRAQQRAAKDLPSDRVAKARAWDAVGSLYPQWNDAERRDELADILSREPYETTTANATPDQWHAVADKLEQLTDLKIARQFNPPTAGDPTND